MSEAKSTHAGDTGTSTAANPHYAVGDPAVGASPCRLRIDQARCTGRVLQAEIGAVPAGRLDPLFAGLFGLSATMCTVFVCLPRVMPTYAPAASVAPESSRSAWLAVSP